MVWRKGFLVAITVLMCFSVASYDSFYSIDNKTETWTYYSTNESFEGVSNSINIIVENNAPKTEQALTEWREAEGTDRYLYIRHNGSAKWQEEYSQLEKGNYYSTRKHLRLYEAGNNTVIQGHKEFWNWFTLRHEVVSNEKTVIEVEKDLKDQADKLSQHYSGNTGFLDSDGWLTIIQLSFLGLIFRVRKFSKKLRRFSEEIKLVLTVPLIFIALKSAPIVLEASTSLNNHLITFSFYLLIVSILPLVIYSLSNKEKPGLNVVLTFLALLIVFFANSAYFLTSYIPPSYILQYFGFILLLSSIPLIKASSSRRLEKHVIWSLFYTVWLLSSSLGLV